MRRLLAGLLALSLLLATLPLPVFAGPADSLASLARYFPAETPVFVALGAQPADIDALDAALDALRAVAPDEFPANLSIRALLNLAAVSLVGGTFEDGIQSWLGDSMAAGLLGVEPALLSADEPPLVIAFEVTDRAALEQFMADLAKVAFSDVEQPFVIGETAGYARYDVVGEDMTFLAGDDVLFLGPSVGIELLLAAQGPSLADSADFQEAFGALPAPRYNLALYVDSRQFVRLGAAAGELPESLRPEDAPPLAMGLTLLEEQALVLDTVSGRSRLVNAAELPQLPPASLEFAANLPADAFVAVMGKDVPALVTWGQAAFRTLLELAAQDPDFTFELEGFTTTDPTEALEEIQRRVEMAREEFRELTGLDLAEDVIGWMTGAYGVFMRIDSAALAAGEPEPFGLGAVLEVTDPAAVDRLMVGLQRATEVGERVTEDEVAGNPVFIIEDVETEEGTMDLIMGGRQAVFVLATRADGQMVLSQDMRSLYDAPRFQAAAAHVIPQASVVAFVNFEAAAPAMMAELAPDEVAEATVALRLLESLTYSARTLPDGRSVGRLAVVLGQ
ncbi:MAG: hypothetical protein Kow0077_12460 [Anaerolineae bacterium]